MKSTARENKTWGVTYAPSGNDFSAGLLTGAVVKSQTKSEARAVLKKQFKMDRLPAGTVIEELV